MKDEWIKGEREKHAKNMPRHAKIVLSNWAFDPPENHVIFAVDHETSSEIVAAAYRMSSEIANYQQVFLDGRIGLHCYLSIL